MALGLLLGDGQFAQGGRHAGVGQVDVIQPVLKLLAQVLRSGITQFAQSEKSARSSTRGPRKSGPRVNNTPSLCHIPSFYLAPRPATTDTVRAETPSPWPEGLTEAASGLIAQR